jgi:hypothetical protein
LKAEIEPLVSLVETRQYLVALDNAADNFQSRRTVEIPYIQVARNYFGISEASRPKIGLLGTAAGCVVETYALANAFLEDLSVSSELVEKGSIGNIAIVMEERVYRIREARTVLALAVEAGRKAIDKLSARAGEIFVNELLNQRR